MSEFIKHKYSSGILVLRNSDISMLGMEETDDGNGANLFFIMKNGKEKKF